MEQFKDKLKSLFERMPSKDQSFSFETFDYTMTVKKILSVFEVKESGPNIVID